MPEGKDRVGQQLGNYRLVRLLGEGGFAEVYLGQHVHLSRQAAIKVLHTRLMQEDIEKFTKEARTLADLEHLHIVPVLDFGVDNSTPYLVLALAENGSLRQRHPKGARLQLDTIVPYVKQIAGALQFAHGKKLIHRDVKPENMLLSKHDEILLSDFGLAAIAHSSHSQNSQSTPMAGTPQYMAPEQIQGHPDFASDQYSLGVAVYEWLTGRLPFDGSFTELIGQQIHATPPSIVKIVPSISPVVESVVMKALAKEPKNRYARIEDFARALEQAHEELQHPQTTEVIVRPPLAANRPKNGTASIKFISGPIAGTTFQISKPVTTIGREPKNDIIVPDQSVSREHARLVYTNEQWSIEKLSPLNAIAINKRDVQSGPINNLDVIALGGITTFLFQVGIDMTGAVKVPDPINQPVEVPKILPAMPTGIASIEVSSNIRPNELAMPLTKNVINIGRDPSNDVVISEPVVSAFHAQIAREGNQYIFIHPHPQARQARTLNGIIYQGRHIQGDETFRKPLARGDLFRIGDEHGTLVTISYNDGSGAAQDIVPVIRPIPLGAPIITIGRMYDNMIVLNHPQVSARHARLEQVQGGYRIVDLGSSNHVYVNGQRIHNQVLRPGDDIRIGPFNLTYTGTQLTQRDESGGIRIDALQLRKENNKGVILLNDISIVIPPRKFVALVGGSGVGKSTLMDALNGLRPAQKGAVFYNGKDYYHHLAAFSTQMGYVPQGDIVHRELTVERALYYTARMRLPEDFTEEQVRQRIDEVLDEVEMKHRRKLLVSKLSWGQRKRVSIALELLANPSVFFLDEPTLELDIGQDRKMMFLLRKLADKGHTIVLVTDIINHINACDYICFLAQGGRLVFFGPPNDAKTYFGKTDFAEIYSALEPTDANPNIPAEAEARFRASPLFQQYVVAPLQNSPAAQANRQAQSTEVVRPKSGDPWRQFSLLSRRHIELLINNMGNLLILLLQAPIIAMILFFMLSGGGGGTFNPYNVASCILNPPGSAINISLASGNTNSRDCTNVAIFLNTNPQGQAFAAQNGGATQALQKFIRPGSGFDAQKYLFLMVFAAIIFGCINGAREIVKEAPVYRRERTVNLGIIPYIFSKFAVLGALCLLQCAFLVLVVNAIAPIQQGIFLPAPLEVYITISLTALAGLMIGLLISTRAPNNDRALVFVLILLIPQVIFSGILFQINGPFLQILSSFFAVRWGLAAAGSSTGIHGEALGGDSWSYQGTLFSTNSQAAATLHLLLCWSILVIMIVGLGVLTAYLLKRKDVRA